MTVVLDEVRSNQAGISLVLDGHSLKIEDVAAVARHRQPIQLYPDAVARINKCRDLLERKIRAREIMYGGQHWHWRTFRSRADSRAGGTIPEILALLPCRGLWRTLQRRRCARGHAFTPEHSLLGSFRDSP